MQMEEEKRFQFFLERDPLSRTYGSAPPYTAELRGHAPTTPYALQVELESQIRLRDVGVSYKRSVARPVELEAHKIETLFLIIQTQNQPKNDVAFQRIS
jgi:hypothetical protein